MKDKFVTFVIGFVAFIAMCSLLVLIVSTEIGSWLLLGAVTLVASYVIGWLIRDIWHMKHE